jgi:hypothetical protein
MSVSGDESNFIPPPPGDNCDYLSLFSFPIDETPLDAHANIASWVSSVRRESPERVQSLLHDRWRELTPLPLRHFAQGLCQYHPIGVLWSRHYDQNENTWLVLSRTSRTSAAIEHITEGADVPGLVYLERPFGVDSEFAVAAEDIVANFFLNFGGMRHSPPFRAGFFYRVPSYPTRFVRGELQGLQGSSWEDARAIYLADTGDELLLNSSGQLAWLMHTSGEITLFMESFATMLEHLAETPGLFPR